MTRWVNVNTFKITRIGYNREVETLFIDFVGSHVDTPYKKVPESLFNRFIESDTADTFYDQNIKDVYESVQIDSENNFDKDWNSANL